MENEIDIFDLSNQSDLPQELRNELVVNKRDDFEQKIIDLFKLAGVGLNIDQIQAGYFRKYGEHKERSKINSKLYNMSRANNPAIESVTGKKGVYKMLDNFDG